MKGSEFTFDYVNLSYCKCHKINLNLGGSYIDSPDQIKNKKATINPINKKDNKCIQYAITVSLNNEKIEKNPDRISKIKPFIEKHIWEGINYPSIKDDWQNFQKNNLAIALNVLYAKNEDICPAYVSKHNSNHKIQVNLLMIPNGEGWHCIVVKKLFLLLRGIMSEHHGDSYCLNCFHSFATESKLELHKKDNVMASEYTKILEFNQY